MSSQVFGGKWASQKQLLRGRASGQQTGKKPFLVAGLQWRSGSCVNKRRVKGTHVQVWIHAHLLCLTLGNPLFLCGPHSDSLAMRNLDLIWFTMFKTTLKISFELKAIEVQ